MCAYPTLNFQTRYPKHFYFFFIWLKVLERPPDTKSQDKW